MREIIFILILIIVSTLPIMLSRSALEAGSIHVTPKLTRDQAITNQVISRLARHPKLAKRSIQVTTRNGVVCLSGLVADDAEARDALVASRKVAGVTQIQVNLKTGNTFRAGLEKAREIVEEKKQDLLKVRTEAESVIRESVEQIADAGITASVKLKFMEDAQIDASRINVQTHRGIVYLTGTLRDSQEAQRAVHITHSVRDVIDVDSRLALINPDTGS